jgi:transcriptional regulator of acetoin/glycerol metabolism
MGMYGRVIFNSLNSKETLSVPDIALTSDNIFALIEKLNKKSLLKAIEHCGGNVCKAARVLKISHGTIYNNVKRLESRSKLTQFPCLRFF